MTSAQIHRFRDSVAIWIADGRTTYLSPEQARAIASALMKHADDVERVKFTLSTLSTIMLDEIDEDANKKAVRHLGGAK